MRFHQCNEIGRYVSSQCRFSEVWIGGDKVFRSRMQVGEVATPAAGNQDLFADAVGAFEHCHAPSALARLDGTHQPSRTATENHDVKVLFHSSPASGPLQWMSISKL